MSTIKSSAEHLTLNADGANNDVIIQSNGSTKVTVDGANGNVGIGTTSPAVKLEVRGVISAGAGTDEVLQEWAIGSDNVKANIEYTDASTSRAMNFGTSTGHDLILKTNDTTQLTINTTGAVTMPNQPSVAVGASVAGYTTVNSGSVAPFDNIDTQTGGSNYNTSTYRYTAPVAGWYQVDFSALSQSKIDQEWMLRKNANAIRRCFESDDRGWQFSAMVYCAVNDYLDIESNSSNSNNMYGNITYSWVNYRLLG